MCCYLFEKLSYIVLNFTCILTANVMELMSEPSAFRTVSLDRVSEHSLNVEKQKKKNKSVKTTYETKTNNKQSNNNNINNNKVFFLPGCATLYRLVR